MFMDIKNRIFSLIKIIILFFLLIITTFHGLKAETNYKNDSIFQCILKKFASINCYKSNLDYLSTSGNFLQNFTLIIGRYPSDLNYGFNFHIYSDRSKGEDLQFLYNSAYFISQNKNSIKHLNKDKATNYKDSINILLGSYSETLDYSIFELEKILKNKTNIIIRYQDNVINSMPCHHYTIKQKNETSIDIFFDKQTLLPLTIEIITKPLNGKKIKKFLFYRNTVDNPFKQINYFGNKVLFYNQVLGKASNNMKSENLQGKIIKDWKFPILNSKDSLSSIELKGKIVVIEFTAIFCGPCRQAISEIMNPLVKKYKNNNQISIITVFGFEKDKEMDILEYCKKNDVQCKNVLFNANGLEEIFRVNSYPVFYILDENSKIIYQDFGRIEDAFEILDMEIGNINK